MLIHLICAARPNFMKVAPLFHALTNTNWAKPMIVHTGQHYDLNMSDVFFTDLGLPQPHFHLGVGSGSHAVQTGNVMIEYEKILNENRPDLVIVVGDVNSTMAATISAVKLGVKTAHLEAGLRSFDRTMPEEINRIVTDSLADILWVPSSDAIENLLNEGIPESKIINVGNIMLDSLEMLRDKIESLSTYREYKIGVNGYVLVTLHRPSNVDNASNLSKICETLIKVSKQLKIIFPIHPRTWKNMEKFNLLNDLKMNENIILPEPLGYLEFMNLLFNCSFVITDSGGIQEETTYLNKPCLTLRPNTERPITIQSGTNQLCEPENLLGQVTKILNGIYKKSSNIENWDGQTASRVVKSIADHSL